MSLAPQIDGTVTIRSSADEFGQAFRRRVAAGLLAGRPDRRSNYRVVDLKTDQLRVHAADWRTATNVGLNDLALQFLKAGVVHYRVRYWRWAWFALGLSGGLGAIGVLALLTLDVRGYIAAHVVTRPPGLSIDENLFIAWTLVLFWGFVWPWLLIALHKRPLHRLVGRIISEVDAQSAGA